jgi:hypothetical protein
MKKSKLLIDPIMMVTITVVGIMLATSFTSCHTEKQVTTIAMSTDNVFIKIEYTGWITFNADKTSIKAMAPGSYLKYRKNGDKLTAKCDANGNITYESSDGSIATQLNGRDKQMLIDAIKIVSGQQVKQKS